jgi:type IV secretion system protein TrbL
VDDLNVIDQFMEAFIAYIDSGFGLLGGDVGFLTTVLIGIDITLAGLFWALGGEDDVIGRFLKKILYVGVFALILNSFSALSEIIFRSFAGLGLTAGGGAITAQDLLMPGRLAGTGFEAAAPLLEQAAELVGPIAFFDNFVQIAVLMIAWIIVIAAFFILAIQLFITILEFKLTSLAGFVLVPFALWNRTSFLAERVLGSVVTSGMKVMVLAVIVGIGSNYFAEFTSALTGEEVTIDQAVSLMLASLAMLGLSIFGPALRPGWSPVRRS